MSLDPYPGESLGLFEAADVTGTPGYDLVLDIHYRDGSRTLGSGDEWMCWFWPDWEGASRYLDDPGASVVVSWVVEVLSGTGTLTAAEGFDPAYDDDGAATPTALGTVTVTGPGTYVIPSSLMGAAEFVDTGTIDGTFVLRLTGTSGSVEVQQVKVQAKPPGGFGGYWSDVYPSFEGSASSPTKLYADANIEGEAIDGDAETAWDIAAGEFNADLAAQSASITRTMSAFPPGACYASQALALHSLDPTYSAGMQLVPNLVLIPGRDWRDEFPIASGLVEGVDWIRPPTEVPGDSFYLVNRTGAGSTGWIDATVTFDLDPSDMPGGPSVASSAGDYEVVSGSLTAPIVHTAESGAGPVALDTAGRDILVSISHSMAVGDGMVWPGVTPGGVGSYSRIELVNYAFGDVQSYAVAPAYRVWSPTAARVAPPLRQRNRGRVRSRLHGDRQRSIRSRGFL